MPTRDDTHDSTTVATAQLIERIASGDRDALTTLYQLCGTRLMHCILQFTPDHGLAEEILQDALLAIWKNAHTFKGTASGDAWLIGVTRRRALKTLRRRHPQIEGDEALAEIPSPEPDPEAALLARAKQDEILSAMEQLTPTYREALLLRYLHDFTYDAIAEVQGVPLGTVRSRLHAAKRTIQTIFRRSEGDTNNE